MAKCPKCGRVSSEIGSCKHCLRAVLEDTAAKKREELKLSEEENRSPENAYYMILLCVPALLLSSIAVAYNQNRNALLSLVLGTNFTAWMVVIVSALVLMYRVAAAGIPLGASGEFLKKEQPRLFRMHLIAIVVGALGTVLWACFAVKDFLNAQSAALIG